MDHLDTERVVMIHAPLRLGERAGRTTIVDAQNRILCEFVEIGETSDIIAQTFIDAMNMIMQPGSSAGNGHG